MNILSIFHGSLRSVTGGILMILLALSAGVGPVPAADYGDGDEDGMTILELARLQARRERMRDISAWKEAVAGSPDDVTIRLALGNAYALNHRHPQALKEYRKVVELYPDYTVAWSNMGSSYRALGQHSKALAAYRTVLQIQPNNALAHYNMGAVYDASGNYDKAIEYYALAFRLDPQLTDLQYNPQVATNDFVFAATLSNYVTTAGGIALPLEPAYPTTRQGR